MNRIFLALTTHIAFAVALSAITPLSGGFDAGQIRPGENCTITWDSEYIGPGCKLYLFNGITGERTEMTYTLLFAAYEWQIPLTQLPGDRYRILVKSADGQRRQWSPTFFTIHAQEGINIPSGIAEEYSVRNSSRMNVHPNPAADQVTVSWQEIQVTHILIQDVSGHVVLRADIENQNQRELVLPLPLAAGKYCVTLKGASGSTLAAPLAVVR